MDQRKWFAERFVSSKTDRLQLQMGYFSFPAALISMEENVLCYQGTALFLVSLLALLGRPAA